MPAVISLDEGLLGDGSFDCQASLTRLAVSAIEALG
jgi:hypothetical protein